MLEVQEVVNAMFFEWMKQGLQVVVQPVGLQCEKRAI